MIAADIVNELESRYPCVQGIYRYHCQTGEPYVVIGFERRHLGEEYRSKEIPVPGTVRELMRTFWYPTEDEACQETLRAFTLYEQHWRKEHPNDRNPIIYWRYDEPHAFWYEEKGLGRIRLRLVLSAMPVVEIPDDEYDATRTAELERDILTTPDRSQP